MTPEQEFITKLTAVADMTPNFEMSKELFRVYDEHLSRLGYENVNRALDEIIANKNSRDPFPSVREIREKLEPSINPDHEAVEVAGRIWEAIGRCGWPNPDAARATIGELGWHVVQRQGGWSNVCLESSETSPGVFKAQLRELAKATYTRASQGRLSVSPAIPSPKQSGGLEQIGDSLKKIISSRKAQ